MSSKEIVINIENVSKQYDFGRSKKWRIIKRKSENTLSKTGHLALSNINFSIHKGESVGIIGRNGAGKSTLLQIITGSLKPTQGNVEVRGRVSALLELGTGFNPEFTGRENIYLVGAVLGMSDKEIANKYNKIIQFADIGDFIDKPVKSYSSGMLVRLAFSLQAHVDPDILIVDEALSVGDIFFQQKCIAKIREILDRGVTLLFVSHGLNSVKSLCQRAIHIEKGVIVADGAAENVCDAYQNNLTTSTPEELRIAIESTKMAASERMAIPAIISKSIHKTSDEKFNQRITQRSGSGELQFTGMEIINAKGQSITSIEQATRVTIRSYLLAKKQIPEGAVIGILIRDANGVDLIALNSDFYGKSLPELLEGSCYAWDIEVDLPLAKGYYSIHCGVKPHPASTYFYDRCFGAALLEVLSNPEPWGNYGGRIIHTPFSLKLFKI